jgi:hypothetical protein
MIPTQGKVVSMSKVNLELAGAREILLKYVQQLEKQEKLASKRKEVRTPKKRLTVQTADFGAVIKTWRNKSNQTRQWILIVLIILFVVLFSVLTIKLMCASNKKE